jgi:ABC-2 type transport system permease protein
MNKTFAVARWEYLEKIKSKAFLISLFLMPAIMIGFGVVPTLFATRPDTETKVIGVIDPGGDLAGPLASFLEEHYTLADGRPNYILRPFDAGPPAEAAEWKRGADSMALNGSVEGILVLPGPQSEDSAAEYRSQNVGNIKITERLSSALRDVVVERKLRARGFDPALVKDLTRQVDLRTIKITSNGGEEASGFGQVFISAYIFMMMMLFLVATSGQLLVRSMLEEKSNRVVEILMSSASANDLMAGKVIGLSGLGLTQIACWGAIGIATSLKFGVIAIAPGTALLLLVYLILGYLLYAAIFVTAGAPVSTEQEAQQITSYITIILVIPIALAMPVMENPDGTVFRILSFIPLLTPTMMAIRIPVQMPSVLEILGSIALLGLSAVGMMFVAGKVFRTTILMVGKRPSLAELWRIIRTP